MNTLLKTSLLSTLAIFACAAALPAKVIGSGNVKSETRNVSNFHSVELLNSGNVIITQGDTEGLVIAAEDNILPLIEATVTANGTLRLGYKAHEEVHLTQPIVFKVSVKSLDAIVLAGSGNITSKALKADTFAIKLIGSGDIAVDHLETGTMTLAIDGSGDVKLAGKATSQNVNVSGSGDYEGAGLKTGAATLDVAGSGDCEISASDTLGVNVSGSGDVSYYGTPKVTKHVSGSGSVESLGAGK